MNAVGGRVLRRSVTAEPDPTVAGVCDEDHRSKARASKRSVTTKCAVDLQAGTQTTGRQTTGRPAGRQTDRQARQTGRQAGRCTERRTQKGSGVLRPASKTRSQCMR